MRRESWVIVALLLVIIVSCMFMGSNVYEGLENSSQEVNIQTLSENIKNSFDSLNNQWKAIPKESSEENKKLETLLVKLSTYVNLLYNFAHPKPVQQPPPKPGPGPKPGPRPRPGPKPGPRPRQPINAGPGQSN